MTRLFEVGDRVLIKFGRNNNRHGKVTEYHPAFKYHTYTVKVDNKLCLYYEQEIKLWSRNESIEEIIEMRMWMIEPKLLCRKHLLGEHFELHQHKHNFEKKHSIAGRVSPIVLIEPGSMQVRHDQLAGEMLQRGMAHKSPYIQPDLSHLPKNVVDIKVDLDYNLRDLHARCEDCRRIYEAVKGG